MSLSLDSITTELELLRVSADSYCLGTETDNSWCVTHETDGTWHMFWQQRGERLDEVAFSSEETVCLQLIGHFASQKAASGRLHIIDGEYEPENSLVQLGRLTYDQLHAGLVLVDPDEGMWPPMRERDVAVVDGREYEAAFDEEGVVYLRWYRSNPPEGFEKIRDGFYVRQVSPTAITSSYHVKWLCEYREEPCLVVGERDGILFVDYIGHNGIRAEQVGFTIQEKFVAVGEFPRDHVTDLREIRTPVPN